MATCYRHPDRETELSCSNCGRPICPECMTHAAVGIRCPECTGRGAARAQRTAYQRTMKTPWLTYTLIGTNLLFFALTNKLAGAGGGGLFSGGNINQLGHDMGLYASGIQAGQYYRLISDAFLHFGIIHIALNMYVLWILGAALERYPGPLRFGMVYFVSALTASFGALLLTPNALTGGASGAIFGVMGALFVLERQQGIALLGGPVAGIIVINLVFTFGVAGISIGGHIGGLIGGILVGLILTRFGRGHLAYSPMTPLIALAICALGAAAVAGSVAVAG